MKQSAKPVRKCHTCLLNLGETCWKYENPRYQWRHHTECPGFENEKLYSEYKRWKKLPTVKTRKEIRRDAVRGKPVHKIRVPSAGAKH